MSFNTPIVSVEYGNLTLKKVKVKSFNTPIVSVEWLDAYLHYFVNRKFQYSNCIGGISEINFLD